MLREEPAWAFEHSIHCRVTPAFAWAFWTNVQNWALDSDVESVEINGPFAAGTRGYTNSKSSGRIEWSLAEVFRQRAVIEFPVPGAVGRCVWTFEDTAGYTLITQRWTLQGEQALAYVKTIAPSLEAGIPVGMEKLGRAIENALSSAHP